MEKRIVIYLQAQALDKPIWAAFDTQNQLIACYQGEIANLIQQAKESDVYVLVPAQDLRVAEFNLPKMSYARLMQALPFVLEDQVIDELDNLHFAISDSKDAALIVSHEKMQTWLDLLDEWQLKAVCMTPSIYGLPLEVDTWYIYVNDIATVRLNTNQGFVCDLDKISEYLSLALAAVKTMPNRLKVYYAQQALSLNQDLGFTVEQQAQTPEQMMMQAARLMQSSPPINLLQGRYKIKSSPLDLMNKFWKKSGYLILAWLGILILYPFVSSLMLDQRLSDINQQIQSIYKKYFPQATSLVAPELRMKEKLQQLNGDIGDNKLLLMLAYVGKGIEQHKSVHLKQLSFQGSQLNLDLNAANAEEIDAFANFLSQHGFAVKQQNANIQDTRVNAVLQVE